MAEPVVVNNVLYNEDAIVAAWINEQFPHQGVELVSEPFRAFGIINPNAGSTSMRDSLIAGCYFFRHIDVPTKRDIWVCAAMTDAAASHRSAIKQILHYPFTQLGLPRITAECDMSNTRVLRQLDILGFVQEGIKPAMNAEGASYGYFGLYPHNCPFWRD